MFPLVADLILRSHVALWVSRSAGREKERRHLSCLFNQFVLTNQKTGLKGRLLKGKRSLIGHVCSTRTVELFQNSRRSIALYWYRISSAVTNWFLLRRELGNSVAMTAGSSSSPLICVSDGVCAPRLVSRVKICSVFYCNTIKTHITVRNEKKSSNLRFQLSSQIVTLNLSLALLWF